MQVGSASINTTDRMIDNTITVVCGHDAAQETHTNLGMYYTQVDIMFHSVLYLESLLMGARLRLG